MSAWMFLQYILGISLLHSVHSQGSYNYERCLTARKEPGECVMIKKCPFMYNLSYNKSNDPESIEYLRGSLCGYEGRHPKICCPTEPPTSKCGYQTSSGIKVVGGTNASLGDWPWIAALGYRSRTNPGPEWYCGSTLINNRYVLTAAHCIVGTGSWKLYMVRLGDLNLDERVHDLASPVDVEVDQTIVHEWYSQMPVANDIALVRLKRAVQFTQYIVPICLPTASEFRSNYVFNQPAYVAGWGHLRFGGKFSPALQDLSIPILSNTVCSEAFSKTTGANIDKNIICAGYLTGGKDTCQGDSGGPLMYIKDNVCYLVGIVSYGYRCAEVGYPGIYTRVSEYIDWITNKMTN